MSKYIPGNQKHLTLEDRKYIEKSLNSGCSFKSIAMLASFPRASPDVEEAAAAAGFFLKNVMAYHPFSSFTFGFRIA